MLSTDKIQIVHDEAEQKFVPAEAQQDLDIVPAQAPVQEPVMAEAPVKTYPMEDGSEGIYCTAFHPTTEGYAKHELLNGYDDYPFIVRGTTLSVKSAFRVLACFLLPNTHFFFLAVFADCLNAIAVGAPLEPTLRIFSPEPVPAVSAVTAKDPLII